MHRFGLETDIKQVLKQSKISIAEYKAAVSDYKNAPNKSKKREIVSLIETIKSTLRTEIAKDDPKQKQLRSKQAKIYSLEAPMLFPLSAKEQKDRNKEIAKLKGEVQKIEDLFEGIRTNRIYLSAFEWRIEFPEVLDEDGVFVGFDCLIGNPPYIQLQKMGADADALSAMGYKTFVRTGDIYCLFYELGMSLLKPNGLLSFIISNKWMRAGYGSEMRRYCVEYTNPIQLIDFSGFKVFDTATVDVNIIMSEKSVYLGNTLSCVIDKQNFSIDKMSDYCISNLMPNTFTPDSWVVLSPIEQRIKEKIERIGTPLKDWDIQINYGIKTGYNEAFIIDGATKDALIAKSPKNAEIIRPILRGRDIKRYKAEFADLWLIATFPSKKYNIDDYPAVKEHLLSFGYDRLKQTGENGSRKKTNNQWFETQDSISYWEDFSKQKIVWGNLCLSAQYAMVDDDVFINAPSTMIISSSKYLLGILNSKLSDFYIRQLGVTRNGGYFEYKPMFVSQLPVLIPHSNEDSIVSNLVEEIMANSDSGEIHILESQINSYVYNLYGLTDDEILFIDTL